MAEDATNVRVCRALRGLHPVRVENPACAGTPDVNYTGGWIENKHMKAWPVRDSTIVRLDHFTPQQRSWHIQRAHAGGTSFVFLQVGREYLLFLGTDAARELGKVDRKRLYEIAKCVWPNGLVDHELRAQVTSL